jgi:hypothetical protein
MHTHSAHSWSPVASATSIRRGYPPSLPRRAQDWPTLNDTAAVTSEPSFPITHAQDLLSADAAEEYSLTPTEVLLELARRGDHDELVKQLASALPAAAPQYRLHYRDTSLYAWFESVGWILMVLSIGGAALAMILG